MEIQVWVGDLAEYNNGNLVGEWVKLPMEIDEIMEKILVKGNEEWFVADTDSEICLDDMSLNEMNELAEKLESMEEYEKTILMEIINSRHFQNIEEAINCLENSDYMMYEKCSDMSDIAYEYYEQTGQLQELEKVINSFYINWEAIGRDMEIEGSFYRIDSNSYIQIF